MSERNPNNSGKLVSDAFFKAMSWQNSSEGNLENLEKRTAQFETAYLQRTLVGLVQ